MLPSRQLVGRFGPSSLTTCKVPCRQAGISLRNYSDNKSSASSSHKDEALKSDAKPTEEVKAKKKTQAELDQEFLLKMQDHEGDGGLAGVEYEDGKPVSMKRSVKNNMFRYI